MKEKVGMKRLLALLLALLLCAACGFAAFADETGDASAAPEGEDVSAPEVGDQTDEGGTVVDTTTVLNEDGSTDTFITEQYGEDGFAEDFDDFFDRLETGNGINFTLFWTGLALAGGGVLGLVLLIVISVVSARRRSLEDDRGELFDEIQEAEQRVKRRSSQRPTSAEGGRINPRADTGDLPRRVYDAYDDNDDDGYDDYEEQPIVPSTPAAMQPNRTPRPAAQPRRVNAPMEDISSYSDISSQSTPRHAAPEGAKPRTARPAAAKPAATAQPGTPKQTAPKPAAQPKPVAPAPQKFDLDDILREVRESKDNNE